MYTFIDTEFETEKYEGSSNLILREYTVKEHIHTSKKKGYLV